MKQNNIDFEYLVIFSNGRYLKNQQLKIDNQTNITLLDGINDSKLMYRVKHYDSEKNFNEYFSYDKEIERLYKKLEEKNLATNHK